MITSDTWKRLYRISTQQDQKTNVEMSAKLGEEYGELLREVLIHEGADGTQYRGTPVREQLLEEVADVLICIAAIAARYKVDEQEFEYWVNKKADKWEEVVSKKPLGGFRNE